MTVRRRLLALAGAALLGGCASSVVPNAAPDPAAEIAALKTRVLELQKKAVMSEVEIDRLRRQVAVLEQRLGIEPAAPRRSPAAPAPSSPRQGAGAEPEPMQPPAVIEEVDLDEATAPSRPPSSPPAPREPEVSAGSASASGDAPPLSEAAQALYDRGYTLYHQGQYVDAEASFQRFLQSWGGSELADNALYWIGEARYARGDFQGALSAFRETQQKYPGGNKVPDAMLKGGQCLEGLGDLEGARDNYRDLARQFPTTAAAAVAQQRLRQLP